MIEVSHLRKVYGGHTALEDLTVTIRPGVVCGLLGPNGAGKSTTLNILSGCLAPTGGEVRICGHDILAQPLEARRCMGYLPEQPPLYPDMTPLEYLDFIADARGIPGAQRYYQVCLAMEQAGIADVSRRLIRNLSKGYRQRVGLARALVGDPEVIILDEPMVGLDPLQLVQLRELISALGENHTVLLSSHLLPEISALCHRVLILSHGRLLADDTPEGLGKRLGETSAVRCRLLAEEARCRQVLEPLNVRRLELTPGEDATTLALVENTADPDLLRRTAVALAQAGIPVLEMAQGGTDSLEEVFLRLTQTDDKEAAQ